MKFNTTVNNRESKDLRPFAKEAQTGRLSVNIALMVRSLVLLSYKLLFQFFIQLKGQHSLSSAVGRMKQPKPNKWAEITRSISDWLRFGFDQATQGLVRGAAQPRPIYVLVLPMQRRAVTSEQGWSSAAQ